MSVEKEVFDLMWEVRKFTRSSLMLQHVIAQKAGLHVTDAECIDFLMEMGPSTAGALAKATRLTTGAITNVIDRLERSGFVKRSPDPNDRRKVVVSYIPQKKAGVTADYTSLAGEVQQLFIKYNLDELRLLITNMRALTDVYIKQMDDLDKGPIV
jgi:DNA-binding MarR family transcriptional regulator